ncbi:MULTISPECIES: hypothetical protein [unclassified Peribacillus]|uniref:hypothetical protein n=1 Tax=unclassified Peribacillus TaxID=2675266 RepID=UPI001E58B5D7|nr:hypothetical protein [Peribacillus sp. Bi96]
MNSVPSRKLRPSPPNKTLLNPTLRDVAEKLHITADLLHSYFFEDNRFILSRKLAEFRRDDVLLDENEIILSGDSLSFVQQKPEPFIFQDIFRHIEIDFPRQGNKRFILIKNEQETTFQEQVSPEDRLKILWPTIV